MQDLSSFPNNPTKQSVNIIYASSKTNETDFVSQLNYESHIKKACIAY